jgi:hypothetical protein
VTVSRVTMTTMSLLLARVDPRRGRRVIAWPTTWI